MAYVFYTIYLHPFSSMMASAHTREQCKVRRHGQLTEFQTRFKKRGFRRGGDATNNRLKFKLCRHITAAATSQVTSSPAVSLQRHRALYCSSYIRLNIENFVGWHMDAHSLFHRTALSCRHMNTAVRHLSDPVSTTLSFQDFRTDTRAGFGRRWSHFG